VIISRAENDLMNIKDVYFSKYKRTLEAAIRSETSGDYKKLLLMLVGTHIFDANGDAKALRRAMKGLGTNEETIVNVFGGRTFAQRKQIASAYHTNYQRDLLKDFISETSGNFQHLLKAMLMERPDLDAYTVQKAIKGLGTDDDSLIEILCTRTNQEIKDLAAAYQKTYGRTIESDVHGDTSGDYRNLLTALLRAERDESGRVDSEMAKADAAALYKAGVDKIGTDEDVFIQILTSRNYPQLRLIFDDYDKMCDKDIIRSIKAETSFNFKKCLVTIVESVQNPSRYFAKRLHEAMEGVGTNEDQLVRIILCRAEIDMAAIRNQYRVVYRKTLERDISGEQNVRGSYKHMLQKIIETAVNGPVPSQQKIEY